MTSTNKDQINCIYAGGTSFSKQLEAFLKSSKKEILSTDITKSNLSGSQWAEILEQLETPTADLIDLENIEGIDDDSNFSIKDTIKIINKNPEALKGAILIHGESLKHTTNYTEALQFFDVDSAGLEKTMHTDDSVTKSQSNGDTFV